MTVARNNASKCKMCRHHQPRIPGAGDCNAPLPVWAWDLATELTRTTRNDCPAAHCPTFEHFTAWQQRLEEARIAYSSNTHRQATFDDAALALDYDPLGLEPKQKPTGPAARFKRLEDLPPDVREKERARRANNQRQHRKRRPYTPINSMPPAKREAERARRKRNRMAYEARQKALHG